MNNIAWEYAKYAAELYFDGQSLTDALKQAKKLMNKGATDKAKREALKQGQAQEREFKYYLREAKNRSRKVHVVMKKHAAHGTST